MKTLTLLHIIIPSACSLVLLVCLFRNRCLSVKLRLRKIGYNELLRKEFLLLNFTVVLVILLCCQTLSPLSCMHDSAPRTAFNNM